MSMSYHDDRRLLRDGEVADRHLHFSGPAERARERTPGDPRERPQEGAQKKVSGTCRSAAGSVDV